MCTSCLATWEFYPINRESGDGKRKPKLSRKGNVLIRKHLYMAALTATRSDQYLKSIYEASVDHGMCRRAALVKIMGKMIEHALWNARKIMKITIPKSTLPTGKNIRSAIL